MLSSLGSSGNRETTAKLNVGPQASVDLHNLCTYLGDVYLEAK